jgi:chaperone modulatory protein CbpM
MIRIDAVIASVPRLDETRIADWVARGWVRAEGATPAEWLFSEFDVARLSLLRELRVDLALDDDTMPLVLSLLDQIHALRGTLRTVMTVVEQAPGAGEIRDRIIASLKDSRRSD